MWRFYLAIWFGKTIFFITRLFHIGGGSAAPGYYALKIYPEIISKLIPDISTNIIITGTNGKTTTARLFTHFALAEKKHVIRNATGSNLERGIASSLIQKASLRGKIHDIELGVWELDEAAFNTVALKINPKVIVFLNVFRDQLDRYGEVDSTVKKWQLTLEKLSHKTLLLLNADDENIARLGEHWSGESRFFSIPQLEIKGENNQDKRYSRQSDSTISNITSHGLEATHFEMHIADQKVKGSFPIPGTYHLYDLLAAFTLGDILHFSPQIMLQSIDTFSPAFGRVEKIDLEGKDGYICLIKNPTGATEVLRTITSEIKHEDRILIVLNDNFADGTDVSWIWDAAFEKIKADHIKLQTICSGSRAYDIALRLKYAGIEQNTIQVIPDLSHAFLEGQHNLEGRLFILPTYTALLELQKILAKQKIKEHYWKETTNV